MKVGMCFETIAETNWLTGFFLWFCCRFVCGHTTSPPRARAAIPSAPAAPRRVRAAISSATADPSGLEQPFRVLLRLRAARARAAMSSAPAVSSGHFERPAAAVPAVNSGVFDASQLRSRASCRSDRRKFKYIYIYKKQILCTYIIHL